MVIVITLVWLFRAINNGSPQLLQLTELTPLTELSVKCVETYVISNRVNKLPPPVR